MEEKKSEKPKDSKDDIQCPACLGLKYWPFADVASGLPCPICLGTGRIESMAVAVERGW